MDRFFPKRYLLLDWLHNNSRRVVLFLLFLVAALFAGVYLYHGYTKKADRAYLNGVNYLSEWDQEGGSVHEKLDQMGYLLDKHPTLHAAFGAALAGEFLLEGKGKEARKYTEKLLDRASEIAPLHSQFGKVSLMITDGDFSDALEETMSIQTALEELCSGKIETLFSNHFAELYANNLLRIALLEKETGDMQNELAAWEQYESSATEFEQYSKNHPEIVNPFKVLEANFDQGSLSFADYIAYRKQICKERRL